MKYIAKKYTVILTAVSGLLALGLTSCDSDGNSSVPSSGNSSVGAPASILGDTLIINMQQSTRIQGQSCLVDTRYTFVDANTVNGIGGFNLNTTRWTYTTNGNQATILLNYQGGSSETYVLSFSGPNSGNFNVLADGVTLQCNGSGAFIIQ